jgi:hypothetical protein
MCASDSSSHDVLSFSWLVGQNVKVSKGKASKDKAQSYRCQNVKNGVFHGVALLVASVDSVGGKG